MTTQMTDKEILTELNSNSGLNQARKALSMTRALLENKNIPPLEMRRREFEGVKRIVSLYTGALGKWRHTKRRSLYKVASLDAKVQASEPIREGDTVVVYVGEDGQYWVRPIGEFTDGRFERIE